MSTAIDVFDMTLTWNKWPTETEGFVVQNVVRILSIINVACQGLHCIR